jgi:hypothetical protein
LDRKAKLKLFKELGATRATHLLQELVRLYFFIVVAQLIQPPKRGGLPDHKDLRILVRGEGMGEASTRQASGNGGGISHSKPKVGRPNKRA